MSEVESLISKGIVSRGAPQQEIRMQLSWCLEQLHAKLDENRILSKDPSDKKRLASLESELTKIKAEVVALKEKLLALNKGWKMDLNQAMRELDRVSFDRFDCFDRRERIDLQKIYDSFKDATRRGDDGAVELMQLIKEVETIEGRKEGDAKSSVRAVVGKTLTTIVDIYDGLFRPQDPETEQGKEEKDAEVIVKRNVETETTMPSRSGGGRETATKSESFVRKVPSEAEETEPQDVTKSDDGDRATASSDSQTEVLGKDAKTIGDDSVSSSADVTGSIQSSESMSNDATASADASPKLSRPIVVTPRSRNIIPEISRSMLPKFPIKKETPRPQEGNGNGGGDNGSGGGGDGGGSESESDDGLGDDEWSGLRWFVAIFGILFLLLAAVIYLPDDKSVVAERLRLKGTVKAWKEFTERLASQANEASKAMLLGIAELTKMGKPQEEAVPSKKVRGRKDQSTSSQDQKSKQKSAGRARRTQESKTESGDDKDAWKVAVSWLKDRIGREEAVVEKSKRR